MHLSHEVTQCNMFCSIMKFWFIYLPVWVLEANIIFTLVTRVHKIFWFFIWIRFGLVLFIKYSDFYSFFNMFIYFICLKNNLYCPLCIKEINLNSECETSLESGNLHVCIQLCYEMLWICCLFSLLNLFLSSSCMSHFFNVKVYCSHVFILALYWTSMYWPMWHALEHWYVGVDRFSWNTGISALYLTGMMWYVIVLEFMIDIAIPLVLILSLYFLSPHMLIFPLKFNNVWDYTPTAFFYLRLMSLKINCWRGWLWNYLISSALFS